jgi:hypothetical protein
MREWEKITKEMLESKYGIKRVTKEDWIDLHEDLKLACEELGDGGDLEGADEIDDEIICVEMILEKEFNTIWDGEDWA